jgi:hypothetical protein
MRHNSEVLQSVQMSACVRRGEHDVMHWVGTPAAKGLDDGVRVTCPRRRGVGVTATRWRR